MFDTHSAAASRAQERGWLATTQGEADLKEMRTGAKTLLIFCRLLELREGVGEELTWDFVSKETMKY